MKSVLFFLFFVLLLAGCKKPSENSYHISGEVIGAKTGRVVLAKLDLVTNEKQKLDSTELKDGKFEFKGSIEKTGFQTIFFNDSIRADFFMEPKLSIVLNSKHKDSTKITGSLENELFKKHGFAFEKKHFPILVQNSGTAFSAFSTYYLLQHQELGNDSIDLLVNSLKDNAVKSDYYEPIKKLSHSIKNTKVGGIAPDFSVKTVDNQSISLSSYRGKYVLLEFWASWCGPCRANNPLWQKVFEKYSGKNFDMLSVSFDSEKKCDAWKEAIKKDKITWTQASNCNGWNEISDLYGIKSVPQNVFINPEGKIIAKNIEPNDFDEVYKKLVK